MANMSYTTEALLFNPENVRSHDSTVYEDYARLREKCKKTLRVDSRYDYPLVRKTKHAEVEEVCLGEGLGEQSSINEGEEESEKTKPLSPDAELSSEEELDCGELRRLKILRLRDEDAALPDDMEERAIPEWEEVDCGEPQRPHHLILDFTPIPGEDDDPDLQAKCINFWTFVNSQPELQDIIVYPEPIKSKSMTLPGTSRDAYSKMADTSSSTSEIAMPDFPAVKFMEDMEETLFNYPEVPAKYCPDTLHVPDYCDDLSHAPATTEKLGRPSKLGSSSCKFKKDVGTSVFSEVSIRQDALETKKIMAMMEDFDQKNPKSMDPPTGPCSLTHATLQRCSN